MDSVDKNSTNHPLFESIRTAKGFLSILIDLGELQWKLFTEDSQIALKQLFSYLIATVLFASALVASLPIFLLGMCYVISEKWSVPLWVMLMFVGLSGTLLSISALWITGIQLSRASGRFERTAREAKNNVRWIQTVLQNDSPSSRS